MILVPNELYWLAEKVALLDPQNCLYAVAVGIAESAGDTDCIGKVWDPPEKTPNRDLGVWQISTQWHGKKLQTYRWRDPYDNARAMRAVYDEAVRINAAEGVPERSAWWPWHAATNGSFAAFMDDAALGQKYPWQPRQSNQWLT
jgi:hypothetical protein